VVAGGGEPCPIASITMSANSSDVDVDGGGGTGVDGSALAVPTDSAESAISTATADRSHRFVTSLTPGMVHTSMDFPES
jgi:hypothetical protein